jgi:hypothetical protein
MDEWRVVARVAAAAAMKALDEGLARIAKSREEFYTSALHTISEFRRALEVLMREGIIAKASGVSG